MIYTSTRGGGEADFAAVVSSGLAPDGGLYLPRAWPALPAAEMDAIAEGSYAAAVAHVAGLFDGGALSASAWRALADDAFASFRHPSVAPLSELAPGRWMLELFHGPTLSFKDYALQPLARLVAHVRRRQAGPLLVLGATSGDTGSAAISAFAGLDGVAVVILHPEGRVSEVQRRQMTTVAAKNVYNVAVAGTFDDCQRIVKDLLASRAARGDPVLSVNSINWGRMLFQIAFHVFTAARLARLGRPLTVVVPSGNFGNAFSALCAARMGAPIAHVAVATNANDALARALGEGRAEARQVTQTLSPAMDIQVPSNLERLIHGGSDGGAEQTARIMAGLKQSGALAMPRDWRRGLAAGCSAAAVGDDDTRAAMAQVYAATDKIIDPHTAVGVAAADRLDLPADAAQLIVSTAHPAKFPDAVARALGFEPPRPPALKAVFDTPERIERAEPTAEAVAALIERAMAKAA